MSKFKKDDYVICGGAKAQITHEVPSDHTYNWETCYCVRIINTLGPDTFEIARESWLKADNR